MIKRFFIKTKRLLKKIVAHIFPSSVVLMFHSIYDEYNPNKSFQISFSNFKLFVDSFSNFGTLNEVVSKSKKKKMAITFDDGHNGVYLYAYKYLIENKISFTIFVNTSFLDKEGYITTNQLIEMANSEFVNIGSHCVNHKPLKNNGYEQQNYELLESKNIIENIIKKDVTSIAYPYGQNDKLTRQIAEKYYQYAFTSGGGFINVFNAKNKYNLYRMNIDDKTFSSSMKELKKYFKIYNKLERK